MARFVRASVALGLSVALVGPPGAARANASQSASASPSPSAQVEAPAAKAGQAGELRAVVTPLEVRGEIAPTDRTTLMQAFVAGLQRGQFAVVAPDPERETACKTPKCWQKVAREQDATHLVHARVVAVERDFDVEVTLLDGATGRPIAHSKEGCEICGISDVVALLETAAATLRTKLEALAQGPAMLSVVSSPSGAIVSIDAEVVGTTPLERSVLAGKHVLRVSAEGYIAVEREVTFVDGVSESLSFDLDKVPSRLPPRPWGWVSLGVGLASIGTAIAFAAIRDRPYELGNACSGANQDEDGDCRSLWSTEWHVLGFGLAGAALTTLGIAILINSARRRPASRPVALSVGSSGVAVRGRF